MFVDVDICRGFERMIAHAVERDRATVFIVVVVTIRAVYDPSFERPDELIVFMPPTDVTKPPFQVAEHVTSCVLQAGVTPHASAVVGVRTTVIRWFDTTGHAVNDGPARMTIAGVSIDIGAVATAVDGINVDADGAMIARVDIDVDIGIGESGDSSGTDD